MLTHHGCLIDAFLLASPLFDIAISNTSRGTMHHTRFYSMAAEHTDTLGNRRPGMVVDQCMTGMYYFHFFLQAHGGLHRTTHLTHLVFISLFLLHTVQHYVDSLTLTVNLLHVMVYLSTIPFSLMCLTLHMMLSALCCHCTSLKLI